MPNTEPKTITFYVGSDGSITGGPQDAKVGDTLQLALAKGSTYKGAIMAIRDDKNRAQQLVGAGSMLIGSYVIEETAASHTFVITAASVGPGTTNTNGDLHVGSGGHDDGDD